MVSGRRVSLAGRASVTLREPPCARRSRSGRACAAPVLVDSGASAQTGVMTRVQPAARAEPDPEEPGDAVAMVLRRRPIRTGTVLTQAPPPPPVPHRGSDPEDEPGDNQVQAAPHPEAD